MAGAAGALAQPAKSTSKAGAAAGPVVLVGAFTGVSVWVDGVPKPQPRPRAFARKVGAGFVARVFDAGTAEGWKSLIAAAMEPHRPASPMEGPVRLRLLFHLPRPKSRCRKSDLQGPIWCTTKPDFDNLAKAVADCLTQQGWWRDDSQIVDAHVMKGYHAIGERPGAWITVTPISKEDER